ncbi:MAG: hypothetical protein KAR40_12950 [Candidatus Sabulitectum sp.]|nr:hypothetical protein [Candidatus Sabulitectum sp.]
MNSKALLCILAAVIILPATGCLEKVPLAVTNGLENYDIHCVYISRGTDNVWGSNHLPGTDVLVPEKTAEVMVQPGVYDLQVTDEDGDTYTLHDIRIGSDGFSWRVTLDDMDDVSSSAANLQNAGQCPVTITNNLNNWDVNGIWISPSDGDDWGDNHLDGEILYPGDTYTAYVQPDTYDIYIEDEDGDTYTRWSVVVAGNGRAYTWNVSLSDIDSGGG